MDQLPSITVAMPTWNCASVIGKSLKSIRDQDYPQDKVDIIILDGGSDDDTLKIAKSFGARIVSRPDLRENQEGRRAIGVHESRAEFIASIDADNVLVNRDWFLQMIQPLQEDPEIVASQSLWYHHQKSDVPLNRYFALFGVNDPVPYFLNKRDRLTHFENSWQLLGSAEDRGKYYRVEFTADQLPTIGCNGYVVRREAILQTKCNINEYFHIDVNVDLINLGFNKFAFVKNDVLHLTGATFFKFFKKRFNYMKNFYQDDAALRRYKLFQSKDLPKLIKYIIFSCTFFVPLAESVRGFSKKKDWAWFLHAPVCTVMMLVYGYAVTRKVIMTTFSGKKVL